MADHDAQPNSPHPNNPLHGITLKAMVERLVAHYGWEALGQQVKIRCFQFDPSVKSSLKFLRRTDWARQEVEALFMDLLIYEQRRDAAAGDGDGDGDGAPDEA